MGGLRARKVGQFDPFDPFLDFLKHLEQAIIPKPFTTEFNTKNET